MAGDNHTDAGGDSGRPDARTSRPDDRRSALAASRRDVLRTIGAGALLGSIGTASVQAAPGDREFVDTDGPEFTLGGDPVYFSGTNNFWVTDPYSDRSRIDDVLALCDDLDQNLLRTWAFCAGEDGQCLQPEPGVFNEAALQHLDYLVAKAGEHGVRLILSLVNNWDDYGGIAQYVEWADGASEHGDFYVNEECRELYRTHVETLLTRENSITGVEYRNDPAIAMWELANEPRLEDDDTETIDDREAALTEWFADMSGFVKDLDDNHLVTTGLEGFYTRPDGPNWMYGDWTGQNFIAHHEIDTIDVCSFHLYPYHWPGMGLAGQLAEDDVVSAVEWIREHAADARETLEKPALLGEFNVNVQEHDLATRNDRLRAWYDALDSQDAGAATIWQLVLDDTEDHDGFQVYRSESGDILSGYASTIREKSGHSDGTPSADATAPSSLRIGESGDFSGTYSFDPDGSIAAYDWAFDDGATATGERVTHRFAETGSHEAELTVTDDSGATDADIESVSVEGIPEDSFLVEGAGETFHRDTKQCHFASMPASGDVAVTARIADLEPVDPETQAGVMVADDPDAPGALGAATITPGEGSELTRAYDSTVWRERTGDDRTPPICLRVERSGSTVSASVSPNGSDWTEIGSGDVDLPEDVHVGLFVSANSAGELAAARFDEVDWLEDWTASDVGPVSVAGATTAGDGTTNDGDGDEDTTPPTAPGDLTVTETTDSSISLSWDAATDDGGSGLAHYDVSVDGALDQQVPAGTTTATVDGLDPGTAYDIGVSAVDGAGNESGTVTVTATTGDGDDEAPTVPGDLTATETTRSSVTVSWDASTDSGGSGVDGYNVAVDGEDDHTVEAGTTSTTVEELDAETTYELGVSAIDGAGNESDSAVIEVTTAEGDDSDEEPPENALVVNDYDGDPAWSSNRNDLGNWCGAGSFANGGGDVEDGALVLEYDNAGWFVEQLNQDVSAHSELVFVVSGASGGKGDHFVVSAGGVRSRFSDVADGSIDTDPKPIAIDMESAGIDATSPGELRLNFWQGGSGSGALRIEEIRLE